MESAKTIRVVKDGYEKILQFSTPMAQTAASAISLAYEGCYGKINQAKAKELLQNSKQPITIAFSSAEDYKKFCEKSEQFGVTNLHLQDKNGTYLCICKSEQSSIIGRIIKKNNLTQVKESEIAYNKPLAFANKESEKNPTQPSWNRKNAMQFKTVSTSQSKNSSNRLNRQNNIITIDGQKINLTQQKLNLIKSSGLPEVGSKLGDNIGQGMEKLGKGLKKAITEIKPSVEDVINDVKREESIEANSADKTTEIIEEAVKTVIKVATKAAGKAI